MEKMAVPTGDVVKDMDVNREEYLLKPEAQSPHKIDSFNRIV